MKRFFGIAVIAGLLNGAHSTYVEPFESQHPDIHESFELIGKSNPSSTIALQIALSSPNDEALEKRAYEIATPFSSHYRKHLTAEELADWVKPSDKSVSDVRKWLNSHGIRSVLNHDILEAEASISQAESLLNTTYHLYRHRKSGFYLDRVKQYFVPENLKESVEFVTPTITFAHRPKKGEEGIVTCPRHHAADLNDEDDAPNPPNGVHKDLRAPCGTYAGPDCVRHLYNVTYQPQPNTTASTALFLFISGGPNLTDLNVYLRNFYPDAAKAGAAPQLIELAHANRYPHTGNEENIDSQMVVGLSWPAKSTFAFTGANAYVWGPEPKEKHGPPPGKLKAQEDVYLKYWHSLIHNKTIPSSASCSEGYPESALSPRYMRFLCSKIFARAGARGISIMFPSGDGGTYAPLRYHTPPLSKETVLMLFPATCPWVTTVGATFFVDGVEKSSTYNASAGRLATHGFPSGGGFSDVFSRPKYQEQDVDRYIKAHNVTQKFQGVRHFNPNGRGFPDIAAIGQNAPYVYDGKIEQGDGTSVSSPIAAALITMLNDYEATQGRPALGFLNPWLYSHPYVLNDITEGGPNFPFFCCNRSVDSCTKSTFGYPTAVGWDAVTGLGSINLGKMMSDLDDMAAAGALGAR